MTDRVINELMGKDASARFRFIMERAEEAEELDVLAEPELGVHDSSQPLNEPADAFGHRRLLQRTEGDAEVAALGHAECRPRDDRHLARLRMSRSASASGFMSVLTLIRQ